MTAAPERKKPLSSKLLENLGALCNMVRRAAVEAGEITLEYFEGVHVIEKADGSPVTVADQKAEAFIQSALKGITPDIPFVGEESAERPDLKNEPYFWLVDPLDGTKEFISGSGDYTVNIALIKEGQPVLGVVYAPAKGELYAGYEGGPAVRWLEETGNEKTIYVRKAPAKGLIVVASKNHSNDERLGDFLANFKVEKMIKRGSSLKICAIAAGKADLYPRLGPTCEWDTAAGHVVLKAAGGFVTDLKGQSLCYGGRDPKFLNPEFVASSFEWWKGED